MANRVGRQGKQGEEARASAVSDGADTEDAWQPLHDRAYYRVRELLMSGRYAPGVRISLQELSQDTGFTRAPIRDATRRLIAEGALEMRSPRYLQVPVINTANLLELSEIRKALEGIAVESAVRKSTARQRDELRSIAGEITRARERGDTLGDMQKVRQFHAMIYHIAELPRVERILDSIWTITGPYMFLLYPAYVRQGIGAARRRDILAAFEAGDPEAAKIALQADIGNAFDYLISLGDRHGRVEPRTVTAPQG